MAPMELAGPLCVTVFAALAQPSARRCAAEHSSEVREGCGRRYGLLLPGIGMFM